MRFATDASMAAILVVPFLNAQEAAEQRVSSRQLNLLTGIAKKCTDFWTALFVRACT